MKPCPSCHQGQRACLNCRGGTTEFACPDCCARGYHYDVEGNVEDCETCLGDGYLPPDACDACIGGVIDCEVCDGSGEVDDDFILPDSDDAEDPNEEEDWAKDGPEHPLGETASGLPAWRSIAARSIAV